MDYNIRSEPVLAWTISGRAFVIDLRESVSKKCNQSKKILKEVALKALSQIEFESNIKAFLTKPVVAITGLCTMIAAGALIAGLSKAVVAVALSVSLYSVGHLLIVGGIISFNYLFSPRGSHFFQLSNAYHQQAAKAVKVMSELEKSDSQYLHLT